LIVDSAAPGLCLALSVDRDCGIRAQSVGKLDLSEKIIRELSCEARLSRHRNQAIANFPQLRFQLELIGAAHSQ